MSELFVGIASELDVSSVYLASASDGPGRHLRVESRGLVPAGNV